MPTVRKSPDRYGARYYSILEAALETDVTLTFLNNEAAKAYRMRLYAIRQSLRSQPTFHPDLAAKMHLLTFKVSDADLVVGLKHKPEVV